MLALLAIPAAFGLHAVAPLLVPVALGHSWLGAVGLIELLAFNGAWVVFQAQASSALIACGRPSTAMRINAAYVLCLLPALTWQVSERGAAGAAVVIVLLTLAVSPAYLIALQKHLAIRPGKVLAVLLRPAISAGVMLVAVRYLMPPQPASMPTASALLVLLGLVAFGVVVYGVVLFVLWRLAGQPEGAEKWLVERAGRVRSLRRLLRS